MRTEFIKRINNYGKAKSIGKLGIPKSFSQELKFKYMDKLYVTMHEDKIYVSKYFYNYGEKVSCEKDIVNITKNGAKEYDFKIKIKTSMIKVGSMVKASLDKKNNRIVIEKVEV